MTDQDRLNRETEEISVLQIWNEQAKIGKYKPHRSLLPDAQQAIRKIIKEGYDYEAIKSAIRNLAFVLSDARFYFKYNQWTLAQFLSRGSKDDKGKRWLWFHPEYFSEEKWWTKQVREQATLNRERAYAKEKQQNLKPIMGLPRVGFRDVPPAIDIKGQELRRIKMRKDFEAKTGIRI
ncbi:MAG: hypothetical protein WC356_02120 [Candidatus Micrarchaeia archaeon]|jgi:hypothetical protein